MKKVTVELKVKLLIHIDEDADIQEVVNEMDYSFRDTTGSANVIQEDILDLEVTDSR